MAEGVTVKVEGFRELARDFRRMGPEARKDLRESLKPGAALVRDEAKRIAERIGLRASGTLIRRITVSVNARGAEVRSAAVNPNDGTKFNYPRRHEFTGKAHLGPAAEEKDAEVAAIVFEAMDDLFDKYGFD